MDLQWLFDAVGEWFSGFGSLWDGVLTITAYLLRFLFPLLAFLILWKAIFPMLRVPRKKEVAPEAVLINAANRDQLPILRTEASIGRSRLSDIVLGYPAISRNHAVLAKRKDGWMIYDLNSATGVFVNKQRIVKSRMITTGDRLTFGNVTLVFSEDIYE